jgi:4-hydroxy-4-methyl-2-oxoglutarate aldolase
LINHPISCGGLIVEPGDLMLGDADGVCVVPKAEAEIVLQRATIRVAEKARSRERFAGGETLWDLAELRATAEAKGLSEEPVGPVGG